MGRFVRGGGIGVLVVGLVVDFEGFDFEVSV